jgi:hypothetical protein
LITIATNSIILDIALATHVQVLVSHPANARKQAPDPHFSSVSVRSSLSFSLHKTALGSLKSRARLRSRRA